MNSQELTNRVRLAKVLPMQGIKDGNRRSGRRRVTALAMAVGGGIALSGCVTVKAPDKPIVIELNINITQEVVYRLAADAKNTIEDNAEIF